MDIFGMVKCHLLSKLRRFRRMTFFLLRLLLKYQSCMCFYILPLSTKKTIIVFWFAIYFKAQEIVIFSLVEVRLGEVWYGQSRGTRPHQILPAMISAGAVFIVVRFPDGVEEGPTRHLRRKRGDNNDCYGGDWFVTFVEWKWICFLTITCQTCFIPLSDSY